MECRTTIRDPIYNYICVNSIENEIIDTAEFQRLRRVHHIGPAYFTYPSLHHTRFEHSLGVMHLAGLMIKSLLRNEPIYQDNNSERSNNWKENIKNLFERKDEKIIQFFRIVGLLHDIGHTAFSHSSEFGLFYIFYGISGKPHEHNSFVVVNESLAEKIRYIEENKDLIKLLFIPKDIDGKNEKEYLSNVIKLVLSSQMDSDRADYILRDGYMSGLEFGKIDISRLYDNLTTYIDEENNINIAVSPKALSSVIRFITERFFLYRWLYFHYGLAVMDEIVSALSSVIAYAKGLNEENMLNPNVSPLYDDVAFINYIRNNRDELNDYFNEIKEVDENFLIGINNLDLLVNTVISRDYFPVAMWKRTGEYLDFRNALIDGINNALSDKINDTRQYTPVSKLIFFESYVNATTNENVMRLKKIIADALEGELNNTSNILLSKKQFKPYEINRNEIYIATNENTKVRRLSEISPLIRALYREWYSSPQWYIFIQGKDRTEIKNSKEKLKRKIIDATRDWAKTMVDEYSKPEKIEAYLEKIQEKILMGRVVN